MKQLSFLAYDEQGIDCMGCDHYTEDELSIEISDENYDAFMKLLAGCADNYEPETFQAEVAQKLPAVHAALMKAVYDNTYEYMVRYGLENGYFDFYPDYETVLADIENGYWKPDWLPEDFNPEEFGCEKDDDDDEDNDIDGEDEEDDEDDDEDEEDDEYYADPLEALNEDYVNEYTDWLTDQDIPFIEERVGVNVEMDDVINGYTFNDEMLAEAKAYAK